MACPGAVYVEHYRRIERVSDRLFEGEEAVLHVIERIVAAPGSSGRRNVTLGGRATSGRLSCADQISWRPFQCHRTSCASHGGLAVWRGLAVGRRVGLLRLAATV
jgi:hypothetical protein